jgi:hypothetical protein
VPRGANWLRSNMAQAISDHGGYLEVIEVEAGVTMGMLGPTFFVGDEEAPEGIVYHYTTGQSLARILRVGVLTPRKAMPDDRVSLVRRPSPVGSSPSDASKIPH